LLFFQKLLRKIERKKKQQQPDTSQGFYNHLKTLSQENRVKLTIYSRQEKSDLWIYGKI
jgi:hypothetical protein